VYFEDKSADEIISRAVEKIEEALLNLTLCESERPIKKDRFQIVERLSYTKKGNRKSSFNQIALD